MYFGPLLKEAREKLGLTQDELGTKTIISAYEKDSKYLSLERALELAKILEIDQKKAVIAYLNTFLKRKNLNYKIDKLK